MVTEVQLTMAAPRFRCGRTAWVRKNMAKMLVWKVRRSCSSLMSVMSLSGCCSPALLTSMSIRPNSSTTRATARWQKSRSPRRSEEHTSELQSLMRISYAVFCLKKKNITTHKQPEMYVKHEIHKIEILVNNQ